MPHFGLMDADALWPELAALQRAKLHIRAGRRRLRQGKVSYGILTLYDALVHAMQWHIESPRLREKIDEKEGEDLRNEKTLYRALARSGVSDGSFDFEDFDRLVDRVLIDDLAGFDYSKTPPRSSP